MVCSKGKEFSPKGAFIFPFRVHSYWKARKETRNIFDRVAYLASVIIFLKQIRYPYSRGFGRQGDATRRLSSAYFNDISLCDIRIFYSGTHLSVLRYYIGVLFHVQMLQEIHRDKGWNQRTRNSNHRLWYRFEIYFDSLNST